MQYLIMCEGPNEKAIIEMLIDNHKMIIERKDLLNREVFFSRQIAKTPSVQVALKTYHLPVEVWRIGDKLNEDLIIPEEFNRYIDKKKIKKICTKPELEMLLIINENLLKEYNKTKSYISPKNFAKQNIKYNNLRYNNSTQFYKDYYSNKIDNLVDNIKIYKKIKRHKKSEGFLSDYLK